MQDKSAPRKHGEDKDTKGVKKDSKEGQFGENGIFRADAFTQSDGKLREGMGVHSGRATTEDRAQRSGPEHATDGCIRTTDEAMDQIVETAATDPLETVTVEENKAKETRGAASSFGVAFPGEAANAFHAQGYQVRIDGGNVSDPTGAGGGGRIHAFKY